MRLRCSPRPRRWRGARVDLVAIDMPLARTPIVARRASDNAITRAFGGRYCGTHSPSAARPGPLSDVCVPGSRMRAIRCAPPRRRRWADRGLSAPGAGRARAGAAAAAVQGVEDRTIGRTNRWPRGACCWRRNGRGSWVCWRPGSMAWRRRCPSLPDDASGVARKAHEDMIDAIVCAWVGSPRSAGRRTPMAMRSRRSGCRARGGTAGPSPVERPCRRSIPAPPRSSSSTCRTASLPATRGRTAPPMSSRAASAGRALPRRGRAGGAGPCRLHARYDAESHCRPAALAREGTPPAFHTLGRGLRQDGDIVVMKHHWGAFIGTDLDLQLRRRGVRTVVIAGIATNFGVANRPRGAPGSCRTTW